MTEVYEEIDVLALAHEIKNPAAVALAHVGLLRLETNNTVIIRHLNHIELALNNVCSIVHEMLTEKPKSAVLTDINVVLADILATYREAWPKITFKHTIDEPAHCKAAEAPLRLIFSNLLKNAVEAVEEARADEIVISAQRSDGVLHITISNNANIGAARKKPHSNGIGLNICRRLAVELGAEFSYAYTESGGYSVTVSFGE